MKNLLKAKHWQLFLFVYGLPLFYQIILMSSIVSGAIVNNKPDPGTILNFSKFSPLFAIIPILLILYWLWSVGVGLNNRLSKELRLQTSKFRISLIIIVLYLVTILIYIWVIMNGWVSYNIFYRYTDNGMNLPIFALFFLLNVFIAFCFLFSYHFVAKILKTAESHRKADFSSYVGDFFLIWLFPIGIWFIQPRINNLVKD